MLDICQNWREQKPLSGSPCYCHGRLATVWGRFYSIQKLLGVVDRSLELGLRVAEPRVVVETQKSKAESPGFAQSPTCSIEFRAVALLVSFEAYSPEYMGSQDKAGFATDPRLACPRRVVESPKPAGTWS